ncbi:MAG: GNAT family N-acetyltransferase [Candidatus Lokiarchaeota archaeon]|nr:GNAT family N-acetyltransferase [Candidatus Lokiarchaeota archaeon]
MTEDKENKEDEIEVFPFIEGETIDLVAGNSKWVSLICKWQNDPKVRHYARNLWPLTIEEVKKWFEPSPDKHTREFVVFTIYHKRDKRPIGSVGFGRINWVNRNANIFATIGELEYWGKGIVVEASKLLIKYGFTELNFHKIYAGVYSPNARSLRAAAKLGFQKEGIIKESVYVDGRYLDEHKFALFKRDWIKSNQNEL